VKPLSINLFPPPLKERGIKGVRLVNTLTDLTLQLAKTIIIYGAFV
jgi:hypothetical protein